MERTKIPEHLRHLSNATLKVLFSLFKGRF